MAWSDLDEARAPSESGHIADTNKVHAFVNNWSNSDYGYINLKDYGAAGNGSSDDTTPVQNALNDLASGQTLIVPQGIYQIASPPVYIQSKQGFHIMGQGGSMAIQSRYGSTFRTSATGSSSLFQVNPSSPGGLQAEGFKISGINFEDTSAGQGHTLLEINSICRANLDRCGFKGGDIGLYVGRHTTLDTSWHTYSNLHFKNQQSIGAHLDAGYGWFYGCSWVESAGVKCVQTGNSTDATYPNHASAYGCKFDVAGSGIGWHAYGGGNKIIGCSFEGAPTGTSVCVQISKSAGGTVTGRGSFVIGCSLGAAGWSKAVIFDANTQGNMVIGFAYGADNAFSGGSAFTDNSGLNFILSQGYPIVADDLVNTAHPTYMRQGVNGIAIPTKAGVPSDSDFHDAVDGMLCYNSSTNTLYIRESGSWVAL